MSNLVTFLAHETWKKHAQTFQYCSPKNCPVYPGSWKLTYLFNVSYTWYKSLLWASLCISCILQMHVDAWIFCLSKREKKKVYSCNCAKCRQRPSSKCKVIYPKYYYKLKAFECYIYVVVYSWLLASLRCNMQVEGYNGVRTESKKNVNFGFKVHFFDLKKTKALINFLCQSIITYLYSTWDFWKMSAHIYRLWIFAPF